MVVLLLLALTLVLFAFTVLPMWRHESWWVRGLDFPRLQFFVLAAIALILNFILLDLSRPPAWGLVAVVLFCLCYQAWWIIPYTRLYPVEVKAANRAVHERIRILTANVLMRNRNADALIELVREHEPDILVTLESDAWWQTRLDVLESDYPYTIKCPLGNRYGMHVYSKLALTDSRIDYLIESDVPSIHALAGMSSGQKIRMHILHPAPPSPTENEESSERDAELIMMARSVSKSDEPVIVTGDLNDVAWSETTRLFRKISGLLDPRVGRGMYNTYHADYWFIRWPLDHLFHSHHFTFSNMRRLRGFGSDHFPLLTELVFDPRHGAVQEGLEAGAEDHALAGDKLDNHDERLTMVKRSATRLPCTSGFKPGRGLT